MTIIIILSMVLFLFFTKKNKPGRHSQISKGVFLTPSGIINFNEPPRLTDAHKIHNQLLDLEIEQARIYNEKVEAENNAKIKAWNKYRSEHPHPETIRRSCPGLDWSAPKRVIGIRYIT